MGSAVTRNLDGRASRYLRVREQDGAALAELRRGAREEAIPWLAGLADWDIYATLTYDRRKWDRYGNEETADVVAPSMWATSRHFAHWVDQAEEMFGRAVLAVGALEYTKAEWPHFHTLVALGGLTETEFVGLSKLWYDKRGYALFKRVNRGDSVGVASYLTKYFTKTDAEVVIRGRVDGKVIPGQLRLPLERR